MRITRIQDDGKKFIIHGSDGLFNELTEIFDHIGLGISVTTSETAEANILYTENNRDIVLRLLRDHTKGKIETPGSKA
jgi:thiamine monophosphate kinase